MKKICRLLIVCFLILFISACDVVKKGTELFEGEDISINEVKELIGIWTAVENSNYKGGKMKKATYQFNDDGTCVVAQVILDEYGHEWQFKSKGKCYLNSFKSKIRLENEHSTEKKWSDFRMKDNVIYVDSVPYNKVVR